VPAGRVTHPRSRARLTNAAEAPAETAGLAELVAIVPVVPDISGEGVPVASETMPVRDGVTIVAEERAKSSTPPKIMRIQSATIKNFMFIFQDRFSSILPETVGRINFL